MQFFIDLPVAGIKAAVTDHFIMLFGDMLYQTFYEFHNRNGFLYVNVILMTIVMEGDRISVITVNTGRGNGRAPQVTTNVFCDSSGAAFYGFCINVKTIFMFPVTEGFHLFERGADAGFHLIEECGAESIPEESKVEVTDIAPEAVIRTAAFGNEAVDVRIPFEVSAEGMEDHDKTGSKVHGSVQIEEHAGDNTVYGMEETVQEGTVFEEKGTEVLIHSKNTVAMRDID